METGIPSFPLAAAAAYLPASSLYYDRPTLMDWVITMAWTLPVLSSVVGVTGPACWWSSPRFW
jgi:egghead protein (zeste-white 4 protein)